MVYNTGRNLVNGSPKERQKKKKGGRYIEGRGGKHEK
jgi:hypothetical protein